VTLETYLLYLAVLAAFFLRHGLRRSVATVCGDLSANVLQMSAAAFGLTAIIATSADALWIVKWVGVAYLAWIGLQLILNPGTEAKAAPVATSRLFRQGFFTSMANLLRLSCRNC